jgi:hypothetical protein
MAARDAGVREGVRVWVGDGGFILSAPCVGFLGHNMNTRGGSRKCFLRAGADERGNARGFNYD